MNITYENIMANDHTQEVLERADRYRRRTHRKLRSHYLTAARCERMHQLLGVPVVVASTIVGTTIFATLSKQPELSLRIATGLLSIAAAVLAALQTFFKYSEQAEKHRAAAAKYAALYRELDLYRLQGANPGGGDRMQELKRLVDKWNQLETESPTVPDVLYDQAVREEADDKEGV